MKTLNELIPKTIKLQIYFPKKKKILQIKPFSFVSISISFATCSFQLVIAACKP